MFVLLLRLNPKTPLIQNTDGRDKESVREIMHARVEMDEGEEHFLQGAHPYAQNICPKTRFVD